MTETVYVELDALLDTRLGLVSSINQEAALKLYQSPQYFTRDTDDFSAITGIPHEQYLEAWAKRNVDTLKRSIKTHMPMLLRELMTKLEIQEENTPFRGGTDLEVNIWPYVDIVPADREVLCLAILRYAGIQTIPRIVCYDPMELTAAKVKHHYSGLILYNLREWLQHHLADFNRNMSPEVAVLAPALLNGERPNMEEIMSEPDMRKDVSPFLATEKACAPFFQLNYLDVRHYSIWKPERA